MGAGLGYINDIVLFYLCRHVDEAHAVVGPVRHGDGAAVRGVIHASRKAERGRAAGAVGEGGAAAAGESSHGPRRHVDETHAVVS